MVYILNFLENLEVLNLSYCPRLLEYAKIAGDLEASILEKSFSTSRVPYLSRHSCTTCQYTVDFERDYEEFLQADEVSSLTH